MFFQFGCKSNNIFLYTLLYIIVFVFFNEIVTFLPPFVRQRRSQRAARGAWWWCDCQTGASPRPVICAHLRGRWVVPLPHNRYAFDYHRQCIHSASCLSAHCTARMPCLHLFANLFPPTIGRHGIPAVQPPQCIYLVIARHPCRAYCSAAHRGFCTMLRSSLRTGSEWGCACWLMPPKKH